jgi:elongation factor 2
MIIMKLPSPKEAQKYRTSYLYEGPQDDACANAMRACDPEGPTMVFISKMVPQSGQNDRFYAFGRVFSGTVKPGQEVRIMGPNYKPGSKEYQTTKIQKTVIMMGTSEENMTSVPCGNTVALGGIDKFMSKQATISDNKDAHTIKCMKFAVSADVRVSVEVVNKTDLPHLIKGLLKLSKADPLVQCTTEETGEHVIAGCGELHVKICTHDLEKKFAKVPLKFGEPIVTYRESVQEESGQVVLAKSTNKHNRIFVQAEPLGDELTQALEDGKISAKMT